MDFGANQSDVIIVGGGPAGLACAIAAVRKGLQVEVVDATSPPIDKACGEGLLPGSLESLSALGFDTKHGLASAESAVLRGIRFIGDSASSSHSITAQAAFPANPGRGIRRTLLHSLLLDRASSLGVRFHWENAVRGIATDNKIAIVQTNSQTIRARYLIGADGLRSRVASLAGLTAGIVRLPTHRSSPALRHSALESLRRSLLERPRPGLRHPGLVHRDLRRLRRP